MAGAACEVWIWGRMAEGAINAILDASAKRDRDGEPLSETDLAKLNKFLQDTKDTASKFAMAIGAGNPL